MRSSSFSTMGTAFIRVPVEMIPAADRTF